MLHTEAMSIFLKVLLHILGCNCLVLHLFLFVLPALSSLNFLRKLSNLVLF